MITFDDCIDHIKSFGKRAQRLDFAVAFWGRGAGTNLGLLNADGLKRRPIPMRVICNLRLGGTSPDEISRLIKAGIHVRHEDRLHAKVYRFDDKAILGSANASSNGLGFEGAEAHWFEATCVVSEEASLRQIDEWFEAHWQSAKAVTSQDLELAAINFGRNRARRPAVPMTEQPGLIEMLTSQPEAFADKRIYLVCNTEDYSKKAEKYAEMRSQEASRNIDVYEDWAPPKEAILIDLAWYDYPDGAPKLNGLYRSGRNNKPKLVKGLKLYEVELIKHTAEDESPLRLSAALIDKQVSKWREIIEASRNHFAKDRWDKSGCSIPIERVAAYLNRQTHGPVLNVFDELHKYHIGLDGFAVSGNWTRPDILPERICVYQEKGGVSVAGGSIRNREKADGKTTFFFVLDPTQRGLPWPEAGFRRNGCLQTPS